MSEQDTQPNWTKLIRRLQVLPELPMRREVLLEQILKHTPEEVLSFFREVSAGSQARKTGHMLALEALCQVAQATDTHEQLYELMAEVYRLAREAEEDQVVQILVTARPRRGPVPPQQVPGDQQLSKLSLGQRKFLARGHDRHRLERLLLDPEPSVLRNLLRNPSVVEADVIRLAARRPVRDTVLREVQASRWGQRYRVRLALVLNPYTPPDLALKLVGFLLYKDLKLAANDGNLHAMVQQQARRLLEQRRPSRKTSAKAQETETEHEQEQNEELEQGDEPEPASG